ncbi:MAG: DUF1232 domain-containing protein [Methylococcales bacterium]|jgi:uncharacterized membrane protein YkvA (DUF1232 family)
MAKLSHDKAWGKFKDIKGVKKLIESALVLYALVLDGDTPLWVKTLAISALIYLIAPVDAVPDFIPVSGLADDLGVLVAALASLQSQVKPQHRKQAQNLFNQL